MKNEDGSPPPGVELIPEDVQEEMLRVEVKAQKDLIQRIMDDHDFGRLLIENPNEAFSQSLVDELGLVDEVEGHAPYRSKWRQRCYYSSYYYWSHYKPRWGWSYLFG